MRPFTPKQTAKRNVVVTGLGIVTPLGVDVKSTWQALLEGKTATTVLNSSTTPSFVPSTVKTNVELVEQIFSKLPCKVAAPVSAEFEKQFAATPRETRAQLFAKTAVEEALLDSGKEGFLEFYSQEKTAGSGFPALSEVGVNFGMGMPGLPEVGDAANHLFGGNSCDVNRIHPYFVPKVLGNTIAGDISRKYAFRGPCHSAVTACATGAHCIGEAARWIQHGQVDAVVCGSSEACIHPISIAGFSRMKALATKFNDTPATASRPFDKERGGFVMGEGCGALVLESAESAIARGAKIYAEVRGFGSSGDAFHVSSPRPDGSGVRQCLRKALEDAELENERAVEEIAYVNAHATSTPMGDEIELAALTSGLRGETSSASLSPLLVSSSKGHIGHLLGAAGSVESIISLLSLKNQIALPTANLESPVEFDEKAVNLVGADASSSPQVIPEGKSVLCTSFGFGGTNAALIFSPVM